MGIGKLIEMLMIEMLTKINETTKRGQIKDEYNLCYIQYPP